MDACDLYLNKAVLSIKAVTVNLGKGLGVGCGKGFRCLMEGGMGLNSPVTHLPYLPVGPALETKGGKMLSPALWTSQHTLRAPSF